MDDLTPPHWDGDHHTDEAKALVERLRGAFDTDSVPEKNLAIRKAHDLIETQAREIERLKKLIEATSAHFLRLNADHPIMWEGAIDAAMEAVCQEVERQAAELAKFKALAETLAGAMRRIHKTASHPTNPSRNLVDIKSVSDLALHKYDAALRKYKEARDV